MQLPWDEHGLIELEDTHITAQKRLKYCGSSTYMFI